MAVMTPAVIPMGRRRGEAAVFDALHRDIRHRLIYRLIPRLRPVIAVFGTVMIVAGTAEHGRQYCTYGGPGDDGHDHIAFAR
jgi:hypothetical protein